MAETTTFVGDATKLIDSKTQAAAKCNGVLKAKTYLAEEISESQKEEMWALYKDYYESTSHDLFLQDMGEKTHAILLTDSGSGQIKGFSTIKVYERTLNTKSFKVLFSGDTIVDSSYWGQKALHFEFLKFLIRLKWNNLFQPVYWFLLSKGYKTYLIMSRNFVEYWPRHDKATPQKEFEILDMLATDRYEPYWKPELGTLNFEECPGKLKDEVAPISDNLLNVPDIRFFHTKNPGHASGNELCCLGRFNFLILLYFPARCIKKSVLKLFRKKRVPAKA